MLDEPSSMQNRQSEGAGGGQAQTAFQLREEPINVGRVVDETSSASDSRADRNISPIINRSKLVKGRFQLGSTQVINR